VGGAIGGGEGAEEHCLHHHGRQHVLRVAHRTRVDHVAQQQRKPDETQKWCHHGEYQIQEAIRQQATSQDGDRGHAPMTSEGRSSST
jgi:hypothetical protein